MWRHLLLVSGICLGIKVHADQSLEADLLVVGGTESGCAAAVQAARMGIKKIVIVNDIEWVGGQFSAEGLGAIDENRAKNYNGTVPIPRSGIFLEVIEAIEEENAQLYGGIRRPGNTRVITTSRPIVSEKVFRNLLAPYEKTGQIQRFSNYLLDSVQVEKDRVKGATFVSKSGEKLTVKARITIDATDWGDVIQASGAAWEAGQDPQSRYNEPSASEDGNPSTDLNPITWCMILEQKQEEVLFPKPKGYDPCYFNRLWNWINQDFAYTSRRLVDGEGFKEINHPDILLINTPPIDYPLDVYPAHVAKKLEANEPGASRKNLVAMTREQRDIVFQDARQHTLKYYYHLQQRFPKFKKMALSEEFGTPDKLPPKPYIRESLRLKAKYMIKEQDVLGFGSRTNYTTAMFPDAVFSWQFEMDFHPTKRLWTTDDQEQGPWEAVFRGNRRFHRGGTGRAVFPVRSFVPEKIKGLLGAQKSLGYSSIVGSSCRLHDQSIHAGQASGAVAAVSLKNGQDPGDFYKQPAVMAEIWDGLLNPKDGLPLAIWPFGDMDPRDEGFYAIQQLALRRLLSLKPGNTSFQPDSPATAGWIQQLKAAWKDEEVCLPEDLPFQNKTRRELAILLWDAAKSHRPQVHQDQDGLPDALDPLPFTPGRISWVLDPATDGIPETPAPSTSRAFNFGPSNNPKVQGYQMDIGKAYSAEAGFGWIKDISSNVRLRNDTENLRRGFVFTRKQDVWECKVPNGKWKVHLCMGDSGHEQPGQIIQIEEAARTIKTDTLAGSFKEVSESVQVKDGKLTLTLGYPQGGSNTVINWLILTPVSQ